jgi:hypothetical protein
MNKRSTSVIPLIGLAVFLSMAAIIAVAAHWPDRGNVPTAAAAVIQRPAPLQTVSVVMHDPGCHWFQTPSGVTRTLHVNGNLVKLVNRDEAALRIVGTSATTVENVGGNVRLPSGTYQITMVGQAADDNHLKLVVS